MIYLRLSSILSRWLRYNQPCPGVSGLGGGGLAIPLPLNLIATLSQRQEQRRGHRDPRLKIGVLNVRGCNDCVKRCEVHEMMNECSLDVLALSETKMKGRKEVEFGGMKGRVSGVNERVRAKEGVGIVLSDRMWECVQEWKEVSSRMMWVRLKVGREMWVIVAVYGPGSERGEEERESFWESLHECLDGFGERDMVVVCGDMNAKVGDVEIDGVIGKFGVPGVNASGEYLLSLCMERGLIVGNTWFKKRRVNKYTWVSGVDGSVSLLDYVLIEKDVKERLLDVNVCRGAHNGMSDHYLVVAKVRVGGGVRRRRETVRKEVVNAWKMNEIGVVERYIEEIDREWLTRRGREERSIDEEWKDFKEVVLRCAKETCGMRRIGGKKKKGNEWWNDEVRELVQEKRRLYERWLQERREELKQLYKLKSREVKRKVKELKRRAGDRWGQKLTENFRENKRLFWKDVNEERKPKEKGGERVKSADGSVLMEPVAVRERWREYFEELLNVEEEGELQLTTMGRGGIRSRRIDEQGEIGRVEVERALEVMKCGKSTGIDGIAAELLKRGGISIVEWLVRLFNICFREGAVPDDWQRACIVPIYKGKGDKGDCGKYRGISLLSIPGKVYGRVVINRVINHTESLIGEEQCGFRKGRGCVDQIFALKCICEKYIEKGKEVFCAFMDLEKAYDRVDRGAMWQVLQMYGVGGRLLEAVKSFYRESYACVRVAQGESEWFSVRVGLRQGCVMSPWLFNVYMDGVVREVNARVLQRGVRLISDAGMEWEVNQLLFADDTALVADSEVKLQRLVEEFGRVCKNRRLKVNIDKSKVLRCSKEGEIGNMDVRLNGENLEEVQCFRYLGVDVTADGLMETEILHRTGEGAKMLGAMRGMWRNRTVSRQAKVGMFQGIVAPAVLYGSECWALNVREKRRVDVLEMRCLRTITGVRWFDRVRNDRVREMCGVSRSFSERAEQSQLKWYGHLERMDEERLVKGIYRSEVEGRRARGRPRRRWKDGIREALSNRGLDIREGERRARERDRWNEVVYGRGDA